jgi:hypothetical protein
MAAFTWTKGKCRVCGYTEKYRGRPSCSNRCFGCGQHTISVIEIHWGPEKYAGAKAGKIEKFPIGK